MSRGQGRGTRCNWCVDRRRMLVPRGVSIMLLASPLGLCVGGSGSESGAWDEARDGKLTVTSSELSGFNSPQERKE